LYRFYNMHHRLSWKFSKTNNLLENTVKQEYN
jgi:hypothetical protein